MKGSAVDEKPAPIASSQDTAMTAESAEPPHEEARPPPQAAILGVSSLALLREQGAFIDYSVSNATGHQLSPAYYREARLSDYKIVAKGSWCLHHSGYQRMAPTPDLRKPEGININHWQDALAR